MGIAPIEVFELGVEVGIEEIAGDAHYVLVPQQSSDMAVIDTRVEDIFAAHHQGDFAPIFKRLVGQVGGKIGGRLF